MILGKINRHIFVLAGLAGVLVAAINGTSAWGADEVQALRERAQQYWEARRLNDWLTEYQMESGSLTGKELTPDVFAARLNNRSAAYRFQNPRITDVTVQNGEGKVTVIVDRKFIRWGSTQKDEVIRESWVLIKGRWYHKTDPSIHEIMQKIGVKTPKEDAEPGIGERSTTPPAASGTGSP